MEPGRWKSKEKQKQLLEIKNHSNDSNEYDEVIEIQGAKRETEVIFETIMT